MEKFSLIAGIDMGKKSFHAAVVQAGEVILEAEYANSAKGLEQFYQVLIGYESDPQRILLCLEHTGVYIERLCLAYQTTGIWLWVVNPLVIKYAQVDLERLKTDKADARKIAQFAHLFQTRAKAYVPLEANQAQIKDLFRLRKQLVRLRQQVYTFDSSNQDKALPCTITQHIFDQLKQQLSEMIDQVEAQLKRIVRTDPTLRRIFEILTSIPTIGPVTAWQLIFVTHGFTRFQSHKQLACYIGTAPFEKSSGSSLKPRSKISQKAYKPLKTNLTMGAVRHIQPNMVFTQYYHYMVQHKNKEPLWVINSIRNTILKLVFTLIKKNQLFNIQLFLENKKSWKHLLHLS